MKENKHKIILGIIIFLLFLPVIGTVLYSVSIDWSSTLLPSELTTKWYIEIINSPFLVGALFRTIFICILSLIFIVIIMVPTIFIVSYYFPRYEKIMEILSLICFSIPGAVSVVGLMRIYSGGFLKLTGTLYIILGAYFVLAFPFMYRGIKNNMNGLPMREIIESANILGAPTYKAFLQLIIPNIRKGIMVSVLLTFSILFGEFLLVNMLVGGRFQTMQMYINSIRSSSSGHFSSAVVVIYFSVIFLITYIAFGLNKEKDNDRED